MARPSEVMRRLDMRRTEDGEVKADVAILDALTWAVALMLALALARTLRDYWRRRGYISVAQDDRNMFSRVLMGARDSWDNLMGMAASAEEDQLLEAARARNASSVTGTTASTTSTNGSG